MSEDARDSYEFTGTPNQPRDGVFWYSEAARLVADRPDYKPSDILDLAAWLADRGNYGIPMTEPQPQPQPQPDHECTQFKLNSSDLLPIRRTRMDDAGMAVEMLMWADDVEAIWLSQSDIREARNRGEDRDLEMLYRLSKPA